MTVTIARTLDCKGLSCPMPIVKTAQAIRTMTAGDLLEVLATDPGSVKDFAAWSKEISTGIVARTQRFPSSKAGMNSPPITRSGPAIRWRCNPSPATASSTST